MPIATLTRPEVILKDYQNNVISTHKYEFQVITDAELQPPGVYTVERPATTITVEAEQ